MKKFSIIISQLKTFPSKPGVYQFYDINGELIYVGKAKNIKKRVSSYFNKNIYESGKLKILINKIVDIKHIVVDTESDALLLENSLIKKYQPRYNVLLKDDKSFPWICIKKEPFPRIFMTRRLVNDGSIYFGPYTSVLMVRTLLDLIRKLYPLRTCNFTLTQRNVDNRKYKVCLEYHIGNCKGPCEGNQSENDYNISIKNSRKILNGNINEVEEYLNKLMIEYSENHKFEEAHLIKEKIEILKKYQSRSTIVNTKITNADVFSIIDDDKYAFVNFLKVVNGAIIQSHTLEMKKKMDEKKEDLLPIAIIEIRQRVKSKSNMIITPFYLNIDIEGATVFVPERGDKKRLIELSEKNAKNYKEKKDMQLDNNNKNILSTRILENLMKDLKLKEIPNHIECFDNSNFHGTFPVAACVVFKDGKPSKKDYRHYNIKTVKGIDDFASIKEIVYRRYKRMKEEKKALPQLIVIDGGKGQINAAEKSLKQLDLVQKIAVIGIAKRLEEIYFPGDPIPMYFDKSSNTLRLLQYLRNEAHRFGIKFHRIKRSGDSINSELQNIGGIGEKSSNKLLSYFKSINCIKIASIEELSEVIGKAKARIVNGYFSKQ